MYKLFIALQFSEKENLNKFEIFINDTFVRLPQMNIFSNIKILNYHIHSRCYAYYYIYIMIKISFNILCLFLLL